MSERIRLKRPDLTVLVGSITRRVTDDWASVCARKGPWQYYGSMSLVPAHDLRLPSSPPRVDRSNDRNPPVSAVHELIERGQEAVSSAAQIRVSA